MRKLEGVVKEIVDEMAYLQRREARMRDTNGPSAAAASLSHPLKLDAQGSPPLTDALLPSLPDARRVDERTRAALCAPHACRAHRARCMAGARPAACC